MRKSNFEKFNKIYEREINVLFDLLKFLHKLKAHCSPDCFDNWFHEDEFSPSYSEVFVDSTAQLTQRLSNSID